MPILFCAQVPIVKVEAGGLNIDISVNQTSGIQNSHFILDLVGRYPSARPLVRLVKHWAARRGFPKSSQGGLPSFVWTVMAINILQVCTTFFRLNKFAIIKTFSLHIFKHYLPFHVFYDRCCRHFCRIPWELDLH